MKLLFFGSGEFGLPTLKHLQEQHEVVAVVSQPDRPAGRHQKLTPTPVAAFAAQRGLTMLKPEDANVDEVVTRLRALNAQAAVVIAFGQKLSPALIEASGKLVVNLHASLLPRYRGAAPINWAMMNGDAETGVSVISLAQRMDAGLVYATAKTAIDPLETAGELHDRLALMGPGAVGQVLTDFVAGTLRGQTQDEALATRAPKLSRADGVVDFDAEADKVAARIHGLTPWPGVRVRWVKAGEGDDAPGRELILRRVAPQPDLSCFISMRPGSRPLPGLIQENHRVVVRDGWVQLREVQLPGGKALAMEEFVRGHDLAPGDRLVGAGGGGEGLRLEA